MFPTSARIAARPTNQYNNHVSTADTIKEMNKIANTTYMTAPVLSAVASACADATTQRECAENIWYWINKKIRFVTDEQTMQAMGIPIEHPTKELLIAPPTLLSMSDPQGDCDDFSMLAKAMLAAVGIRSTFMTIKADRKDPSIWSHVYVRAYFDDGKSLVMDCSHGHYPGWEYKNTWEKREWL